MRHMGILILSGLLVACALQELGPGNFHKPRMTAEQRAADLETCYRGAYGVDPGSDAYYDDGQGAARYGHPAVSLCMNERGYFARSCRKCPPSPYLAGAPADAALRSSRRQLDQSMAAFDACLRRVAEEMVGRLPSPPAKWAARFILDRCESTKRLAGLAVIHAAQVTRDRMEGKEDAGVAAERFDTQTAPAMAGDQFREAMMRGR